MRVESVTLPSFIGTVEVEAHDGALAAEIEVVEGAEIAHEISIWTGG